MKRRSKLAAGSLVLVPTFDALGFVAKHHLVGDVLRICGDGTAIVGMLKHEVPGTFYRNWSIERRIRRPIHELKRLDPAEFIAAAVDLYGVAGFP